MKLLLITLSLATATPQHACTRPVPARDHVNATAYVAGRSIYAHNTSPLVVYYAGRDTMVRLRASRRTAPICVTAVALRPEKVTVKILDMRG